MCCVQQENLPRSCTAATATTACLCDKGCWNLEGAAREVWSHCPWRCLKDCTGTAGSQPGLHDPRDLSNLSDSGILVCFHPTYSTAAALITRMNSHTSIPRQFFLQRNLFHEGTGSPAQLQFQPLTLWVGVLESSKILLCKRRGKPRIQRG